MADLIDRFISWLYTYKIWGSRCSEVDENCVSCKKWIEHDEIFNEKEV